MRNIIYIAGITSSGKTTTAIRLTELLNLPMISVDAVYGFIADEIKLTDPSQILPSNWRGVEGIAAMKEKYYKKLLKDIEGDFIIEGFALGFKDDREIIKNIIGEHNPIFFYLDPPLSVWNKNLIQVRGIERDGLSKEEWNKFFEAPEFYYRINNPHLLITHHLKYQQTGFTDKKWELLKLTAEDLSGKSVIDLGCNSGWISKNCLDLGAASVLGVDYSWRYLEEARARGVTVRFSTLDEFEFDKQYDIILCLAVFHYIGDKEKFFKKIAEATKEMFILEVPIAQNDDPVLMLHDRGDAGQVFYPSFSLLEIWILKYFNHYEYWPSVSPDNSNRLIFKCYK